MLGFDLYGQDDANGYFMRMFGHANTVPGDDWRIKFGLKTVTSVRLALSRSTAAPLPATMSAAEQQLRTQGRRT